MWCVLEWNEFKDLLYDKCHSFEDFLNHIGKLNDKSIVHKSRELKTQFLLFYFFELQAPLISHLVTKNMTSLNLLNSLTL